MSNRAMILKKQALERWQYVPPAEQKELIEELQAWPRGQAVIELHEPQQDWNDGHPTGKLLCKAQVVNITFGINIDPGTTKRYLFLSDIPQSVEEKNA